jgi:hypothetical protein
MYYMSVYLGRDKKHATATMIAVNVAVSGLTTGIGNSGHRLTWSIFFLFVMYLMIYIRSHKLLWYCQTKLKTNVY